MISSHELRFSTRSSSKHHDKLDGPQTPSQPSFTMKIFTTNHTYDYPFPTVTLAYFLRYPNPYSTHVLATDILARHFDPVTQRLHTTRLHLKQSKLPKTVLRLLPKNILGANRGPNGEARNFVLEKSVVDVREGWMETETRNLQYTGVLSVIERQSFQRPIASAEAAAALVDSSAKPSTPDRTEVLTTVTCRSRFGQRIAERRRAEAEKNTPEGVGGGDEGDEEAAAPKRGFFSAWSTGAVQRTIEATGMKRTEMALPKSKLGMTVVLERMRQGGLAAALEGMRKDRELVLGAAGGSSDAI